MSYFQNSPSFTGVPTAPTATLNTNTTQLATTQFVMSQLAGGGTVTTIGVTTANGVSGTSSGGATPSLTITLGSITPTTVNGLTLSASTNGFTIAGGSSSSKTLTFLNTLSFSGTDGSSLNIGTGGTLGTGAYATIANYVPTSQLGANSGVATLDSGGKLTASQLPASVVGALNYQGTWNANTNSPALVTGVGTKGYYYKVSVAGATTIDGISTWTVGDMIAFDGTTWDKIDGDPTVVTSVNGSVGSVTVAATNQTMYLGTTALAINAGTGTQTSLIGMTSISSTSFTGALTGNASTASALASGATGSLPYQTGSGTTGFLTAGIASQVLVGGASSPAWSNTPAISGANIAAGSIPWTALPSGEQPFVISTSSVTSNTTLTTAYDFVICDATSAAFTITLPTAPPIGTNFTIKKIDSSAHAVTVQAPVNIDSATTFPLPAQWNAITVVYNGTQWYAF